MHKSNLKNNFTNSLLHDPKDMSFDIQQKDEEILLIIREHPIFHLGWIFYSIIYAIALIFIDYLVYSYFSESNAIFLLLFGMCTIISYIWSNITHWYFLSGIITNKRIIDLDYNNTLSREINVVNLSGVEEVTTKSNGYIGSFFDSANIFVKSEGDILSIEFMNSPNPSFIVKFINDLIEKNGKS